MKESIIQSKIIDYLKNIFCYVIKIISASKAGVPDVVACVPTVITKEMVGQRVGVFHAFEVKNEKGKLSMLQIHNINSIRRAGGIAGVVRSVDDVRDLLTEITR